MRATFMILLCAACANSRNADVRANDEALVLEPTPVERSTQPVHQSRDARLSFKPAARYGQLDELGTHTYAGDQTPDFAFDLQIDTRLPIKHLYVVVRGHGQQWDTVIGSEQTPAFSELPAIDGQRTWNLGVRAHGKWLTKRDGSLPMLQAG